jgi:hypothetical protein
MGELPLPDYRAYYLDDMKDIKAGLGVVEATTMNIVTGGVGIDVRADIEAGIGVVETPGTNIVANGASVDAVADIKAGIGVMEATAANIVARGKDTEGNGTNFDTWCVEDDDGEANPSFIDEAVPEEWLVMAIETTREACHDPGHVEGMRHDAEVAGRCLVEQEVAGVTRDLIAYAKVEGREKGLLICLLCKHALVSTVPYARVREDSSETARRPCEQ